jgi:hypothetical protein
MRTEIVNDARLIRSHPAIKNDSGAVCEALSLPCGEEKEHNPAREVLGNHRRNLKKRGWSLGWVSATKSNGRTIFVADAHHGDDPVRGAVPRSRRKRRP